MEDRPLFGEGSKRSLHAQKQVAFLRPAATTDGRLQPVSGEPQATRIPASPVNGTKAMRQNPPSPPQEVPGQPAVPAPQPDQPQYQQPVVQHPVAQQPVAQQPLVPQVIPVNHTDPAHMVPVAVSASPQSQAPLQQQNPLPVVPEINVGAPPVIAQQVPIAQVSVQQTPIQQQLGQVPVQQPTMAAVQPVSQVQEPQIPAPVPQAPVPQATIQPVQFGQPVAPQQQMVPDQQTGSEEDRKEPRKRTLKGGLIVLPGQMMSSYACKIRNESRGGVMLVLSDSMQIPAEFYLVRDADPGHKIPCRVAWRGIGRIGAQFIAALSAP